MSTVYRNSRWYERLLFSLFVFFKLGHVLMWVQKLFSRLSSISSWKKFENKARFLYLYSDLQTFLRFHKNMYTVNRQLQPTLTNILTWERWGNKNYQTSRINMVGRTSIRRKERRNFSVHFFYSLLHNFEELMIETNCFIWLLS